MPSFFLTKNTGVLHGEILGQMNPRSSSSWTCFLSSYISIGAIRWSWILGGFRGPTPCKSRSFSWVVIPRFFWNTHSKSLTIRIYPIIGSTLVLSIAARRLVRKASVTLEEAKKGKIEIFLLRPIHRDELKDQLVLYSVHKQQHS